MERAVRSVRSLENIISTFSKVNVDVSSDVKTFMSSGLIFKAFMKYIVASSIAVGYYYTGAQDANSNALVAPSSP